GQHGGPRRDRPSPPQAVGREPRRVGGLRGLSSPVLSVASRSGSGPAAALETTPHPQRKVTVVLPRAAGEALQAPAHARRRSFRGELLSLGTTRLPGTAAAAAGEAVPAAE